MVRLEVTVLPDIYITYRWLLCDFEATLKCYLEIPARLRNLPFPTGQDLLIIRA